MSHTSAVVAALDRTTREPAARCDAFNFFSAVPFDGGDALQLSTDPLAVTARHWPDAPGLMDHAGAALWGPIQMQRHLPDEFAQRSGRRVQHTPIRTQRPRPVPMGQGS
jgi:hypothetical protein